MTRVQTLLLMTPIAYLIGSIPFGLLVGLSKGIDPRKAGSGNIGATNVGRLLGGKYFALVFTLDLCKGMLPSLAAGCFLGFNNNKTMDLQDYLLWLLVPVAAAIGHMFSIFLGFKGGKGVATSTGALLGIWPYFAVPALACAGLWVLIFKTTRYVSLASIIGCGLFPVVYALIGLVMHWPIFGAQLPLLIVASILAGMIVYRHRANISRLRAGTENRAGEKAGSTEKGTADAAG